MWLRSKSEVLQVLHLKVGEETPLATRQAVFVQTSEHHTVKFNHLITKVFEDATHDAVAARMEFDTDALLRFMDRVPELEKTPLIAGIWPLASLRNAEFMRNEVPGVVVPDSVIARMAAAKTKEEQCECGIRMAREAIERIRGRVAGVQVSAPFGKVSIAIDVIR